MLKSPPKFVILEDMHKPHTIVIASGLSGLIAAAHAQQLGHSVEIIDARDEAGGLLRRHEVGTFSVPTGLHFIPETERTGPLLARLSKLLEQDIGYTVVPTQAVTFDNGKLKNFIGFGDHESPAVEEFNRLNVAERVETQKQPSEWIEDLLKMLGLDHIHIRHEVTALQIENNRCVGVEINGSKLLRADHIIYAGAESEMLRLLPESVIAAKSRQKIAKTKHLTGVSLHFVHRSPVTTETGFHFLGGADALLLTGRFFATEPQTSSWLTLLPDEESDEESIGQAIRSMKRQIKRPYPDALTDLHVEKIVVTPRSHGPSILPLKGGGGLAGVENLFVASSRSSTEPGLLAPLERGFAAGEWLLKQSLEVVGSQPEI
jgi:glycine/D-amino acid oxidase-like deaminating enzyme